MQPVNLSKIEFDIRDEADSNYVSARDERTPIRRNSALTPLTKKQKYTIKETSEFSLRASLIINDLMTSGTDLKVKDLACIRSDGKAYEILPHLYAIQDSFKLP